MQSLSSRSQTAVTKAQAAPATPVRTSRAPSRSLGNQALLRRLTRTAPGLQARLEIGPVDDPLEREADQVADQVMGMTAPPAGMPSEGAGVPAPLRVARTCAACAQEEPSRLQPKRDNGQAAPMGAAPAIVDQALGGGGQPLDRETRDFFEPRFGADFGGVRIHRDATADAAARSVGARAFTVGRSVVFASGTFAPASASGRRLLAHELAHVVQQTGAVAPITRVQREAADLEEMKARALKQSLLPEELKPLSTEDLEALHRYLEEAAKDNGDDETLAGNIQRVEAEASSRPAPPKPKPAEKPKEVCDPPAGPLQQPDKVSQSLIDRMMGRYADKDGDPGEGCITTPYPAANGEKVCTIGYGHQIPDCPILNKATGAAPAATDVAEANEKKKREGDKEDAKPRALKPSEWLTCKCAGKVTIDCKGSEAEGQLKSDAHAKETHVHQVLPVFLTQAQFDAFVDIAMHHGSVEPELIDAVKKYWCTAAGRNYVRELYLKTDLKIQGSKTDSDAFVKRRQHRVWPKEAVEEPAAP